MYSAHLSLRASAPNRHDRQFNEQPNNQRKGSHTKKGIPVMPRAKPEGETQVGNHADNTRDFLEPGSGGKAVAKWDNTCPSQTPRGL